MSEGAARVLCMESRPSELLYITGAYNRSCSQKLCLPTTARVSQILGLPADPGTSEGLFLLPLPILPCVLMGGGAAVGALL